MGGGPPGSQTDPFSRKVPPITSGPWGHNDAGDPDLYADAGASPRPKGSDGPGMRDHSHSNRATLVVADNGADDGVEGWPSDLKWSQFDPLPRRPDKVKEDAKTATSVTAGEDVNIEHDRKGFKLGAFKVPLTFDSSKSWVVNGKTDAPLLRHEQVHWDIAGLNAHELARALKAIRTAKPGGLRGAIDSNFSRLEIKGQAQQLWYDGESKHGLDAAGQKKWQDLVQNAIDGGNLPLPDPPQKYVDEAKKLKAAGEL